MFLANLPHQEQPRWCRMAWSYSCTNRKFFKKITIHFCQCSTTSICCIELETFHKIALVLLAISNSTNAAETWAIEFSNIHNVKIWNRFTVDLTYFSDLLENGNRESDIDAQCRQIWHKATLNISHFEWQWWCSLCHLREPCMLSRHLVYLGQMSSITSLPPYFRTPAITPVTEDLLFAHWLLP